MKILVIMGGFFPGKKYGGPPVSVDNFCTLLKEYECYIVTTNHDMDEDKVYKNISKGWNIRNNCKVLYLSDEEYTYKNFKKIIEMIHADVVYLQGLFQDCVLPCLIIAKQIGCKVLLAPRGELCSGAFKKKYKKIPYILFLKLNGLLRNVYYQSTSDEETEAIQRILGSERNRIFFLTNIPSIPSRDYERKTKEPGYAKFIFLARIHPKKNLLSAIKYFASIRGNVIFDIYGPVEDEEYWERCQKEIEKLPNNIKVSYRGLISHEEVHETFSKYDAFLFPTLSENYGHVIAEALIVGTPVIISDQTPWTDVNEYKAGWALPLSVESGFVSAMQNIIDSNNSTYSNNAKAYAIEKMNLEHIRQEYEFALKNISE